jgi:Cu/Zn superoxide dismutase
LHDAFTPVDQLGGWGILVGKAVELTAHADDYTTQPAGASGSAIACGVIKADATGAPPSP